MLSRPDGLTGADVRAVVRASWHITATSLTYRPVGFGSYHWQLGDASGSRWFVTADDLRTKRVCRDEPLDLAFGRLRASLSAGLDLRACGADFVVAPVRTRGGEPLARANDRFALALYPFVEGRSFSWGDFSEDSLRPALLDLLVRIHGAPARAAGRARAEDYAIPLRDAVEAAMEPSCAPASTGPYTRDCAALIAVHAGPLAATLARYDDLAARCRGHEERYVLTHGEPHPGNAMLTPDGWRLVDWDTALLALPERDLAVLDPGDGSLLAGYVAETGTALLPEAIELYRMRWDLADIASYVSRFRNPHGRNEDDVKTWRGLRSTVERVSAG
jgi:hypothetical protein